ncbi:MAG: hypothetical protein HS113_00965 [Verrucomicrobiales bacterium]|nr:hypothetical protein [Verrucomicrobiales bacterium]
MKTRLLPTAWLAVLLAVLPALVHAETGEDLNAALATVRATYGADRQAFLASNLELTEAESAAFWPFYREYRLAMDKLGDSLVKVVLEYADAYPDVTDSRARKLLADYTSLEEKLAKTRATYVRRAAKIIPPAKALRWAQLEQRLDLALRLQLVGTVPLVPSSKPVE